MTHNLNCSAENYVITILDYYGYGMFDITLTGKYVIHFWNLYLAYCVI